ncbi:unnamed protein product, partial [Ixodes persulcatus]
TSAVEGVPTEQVADLRRAPRQRRSPGRPGLHTKPQERKCSSKPSLRSPRRFANKSAPQCTVHLRCKTGSSPKTQSRSLPSMSDVKCGRGDASSRTQTDHSTSARTS